MKIYEYANCSTCKNALKFLDKKGIEYKKISIVEQPPTSAELKKMLAHLGGDLRKLFNTSGQLYREMKLGEKLPSMTEAQAIALLSKHGKLVKRPFVVIKDKSGEESFLIGFKEDQWKKAI
jgi:arsenate reductase